MSDDLNRDVGRIDGRLTALEARSDRFEAGTQGRLGSIEAKLDSIAAALAAGGGARKGVGDIIRWGVSIATAASGWAYLLFHLPPPGG